MSNFEEQIKQKLDKALVNYLYNRITVGGKLVEVEKLDEEEIDNLKNNLKR